MLNLTPFVYSLATMLPCSSVATAGYYAFRYFFDGTSSTTQIDHSVEIDKDISSINNDRLSLSTHKSLRESQKSRNETEKRLLEDKLATQKKERKQSAKKIVSLTSDISLAKSQISSIQDNLAKKLEEKSTFIAQEKHLSEELHKLKVAEIKEAEAYKEVEEMKKAYDNKVELLKAQDEVAIAHEKAKNIEVTELNTKTTASFEHQEQLAKAFLQAMNEKSDAEKAYDKATKDLEYHLTKVEEEAKNKDTTKGHEITELVILKKETADKKREMLATFTEKLAKQNTEKVECQIILKTLKGSHYNGNCEIEDPDQLKTDVFVVNARKKYLLIRDEVRALEKEIEKTEKEYRKLDEQWLKAKTEKIKTEADLKDAKDKTLELKKLQQKASAMKDAKVAEFIKITGELEASKKEHLIKVKELSLLQGTFNKVSSAANGIEDELKVLDSQKQQVTNAYKAAQAALLQAQQKKQAQQEEINKRKEAIKKLEEEIEESSLALNKQHQIKDSKTRELEEERDNLETLDILIPAADKQIKDKNKQINKLSTEIETIGTKLQSLNSEINQDSHFP